MLSSYQYSIELVNIIIPLNNDLGYYLELIKTLELSNTYTFEFMIKVCNIPQLYELFKLVPRNLELVKSQ